MRLFIDLVKLLPTAELWERANIISGSRAKRGDGGILEVQFHRDGVPIRLPLGTEIVFCVKSQGKFDQDPPLVFSDEWERPETDEGFYICRPSYNTVPLNNELNHGDDDDSNDLASLATYAEITWTVPDGEPLTSQTWLHTIDNDIFKGNENVPLDDVPAYPAPGQILTQSDIDTKIPGLSKTYGDLRITTAGLELRDEVTDTWRRLNFHDGQLQYTEL